MLKLGLLLVLVGGTAAAVAWAPVHGSTVLDRWRAAPDVGAFLSHGYDEARAAIAGREKPRPPARTARTQKAPPRPASRPAPRPAARPTESHTDDDRAALDRIVAEHADR